MRRVSLSGSAGHGRAARRRGAGTVRGSCALAVTAALFVANQASASPTARLVYVRGEGADSCPDEPEMRRAVAIRLGYDPFRPLASTTLTAEIRRENGAFRGRVKLVDDAGVERGARELESRASDCRDLTAAMALSMSIAIDPLSVLRPPPPVAPDESPVAVPAAPPPAEAPRDAGVDADPGPAPPHDAPPAAAAAAAKNDADPLRMAVAAGTHLAFGVAPATSVGIHVSMAAAARRYQVGIEGRFDLAASASSAEGGRSRTSLAGAALVPCVRASVVLACALLLVARVEAASVDVTAPRSDAFVYLGAGGRLAVPIALPEGFGLAASGDLLGHPAPFALSLNGREVYRSSAVSGVVGLTVTRIF